MKWRTDKLPHEPEAIDAMGIDRDAWFVFTLKKPNEDGEYLFAGGIEDLVMCSWDDSVAFWMQIPPAPAGDSGGN